MTRDEAMAAIARLEELVKDFGWADEQAAAEFRSLTSRLRGSPLGSDHYWLEKLGKAAECASDGFTAKRFEYRAGGLDGVKQRALVALQTLSGLVRQRWPSS